MTALEGHYGDSAVETYAPPSEQVNGEQSTGDHYARSLRPDDGQDSAGM